MSLTYESAVLFAQSHGYLLIFLAMIIEGPIITLAAAFASSLGIFNVWLIFLLSILGNLLPDILFFSIGRFGREKSLEKYFKYFGLNQQRIKKLENGFKEHAGKTLVFAKLIPPLPIPGIILAGFAKMPTRKFIFISTAFNIISSTICVLVGYYSGWALDNLLKYLHMSEYLIIFLIVIVAGTYTLYKMFSPKIQKRVNKLEE
jgi:membrane protein DedA with SNARE-associated domain